MIEAVKWIQENQKHNDTIVCSDSLSLLTGIDSSNTTDNKEIQDRLNALNGKTPKHWAPSHKTIPKNELADKATKEAAKMPSGVLTRRRRCFTKVRLNQQKSRFKTAARYIEGPLLVIITPRTFARHLTVNEAKMYSNSEKQNNTTFSLAKGH